MKKTSGFTRCLATQLTQTRRSSYFARQKNESDGANKLLDWKVNMKPRTSAPASLRRFSTRRSGGSSAVKQPESHSLRSRGQACYGRDGATLQRLPPQRDKGHRARKKERSNFTKWLAASSRPNAFSVLCVLCGEKLCLAVGQPLRSLKLRWVPSPCGCQGWGLWSFREVVNS